jgi:hypothetical protein
VGREGYGFVGLTFDVFSVCRRKGLFVLSLLQPYFFIIYFIERDRDMHEYIGFVLHCRSFKDSREIDCYQRFKTESLMRDSYLLVDLLRIVRYIRHMVVDASRRLPLCATAILSSLRSQHSVELITVPETDI